MKMNLKNARKSEQINRMVELKKEKLCHFCATGFKKTHTAPIIYKNKNWFVTGNDFPYKGSTHHYLIVSKKHITKLEQVNKNSQIDLFKCVSWLEKKFKIPGFSFFVRSGDMSYTGATLDHLHFHFLVGKKQNKNTEWLTVTLGYKKK